MRYSIIAICCAICLCSCKSKKVATDINVVSKNHSELSQYHETATIDTTRLLHIEGLKQNITIEETIITKKYDKDTGAITEETETKRKITQDSDKVVANQEKKGVRVEKNDSTHHIADGSKMIESKTEEESTSETVTFCNQFGKWLGIVIGFGIIVGVIVLTAYIRKKLRVSKEIISTFVDRVSNSLK